MTGNHCNLIKLHSIHTKIKFHCCDFIPFSSSSVSISLIRNQKLYIYIYTYSMLLNVRRTDLIVHIDSQISKRMPNDSLRNFDMRHGWCTQFHIFRCFPKYRKHNHPISYHYLTVSYIYTNITLLKINYEKKKLIFCIVHIQFLLCHDIREERPVWGVLFYYVLSLYRMCVYVCANSHFNELLNSWVVELQKMSTKASHHVIAIGKKRKKNVVQFYAYCFCFSTECLQCYSNQFTFNVWIEGIPYKQWKWRKRETKTLEFEYFEKWNTKTQRKTFRRKKTKTNEFSHL